MFRSSHRMHGAVAGLVPEALPSFPSRGAVPLSYSFAGISHALSLEGTSMNKSTAHDDNTTRSRRPPL